ELDWIDRAIAEQQAAVDLVPDDGEARTRLAELRIARYSAVFRQELTRLGLDPRLFTRESPVTLHADAQLFAGIKDDAALEEIRTIPLVVENLDPALAEARQARALCPLAPYAHLIAAKLCFLDESPTNDLFYLDRAERLSGGRANWLFEIGVLHLNASR